MIERRWTVRKGQVQAYTHPDVVPFTHVSWQDPAGYRYVARPGDNPDQPQALVILEAPEDGLYQMVLCGRPEGHPEAELERHTFVWQAA